jgi:hypothetical protein
VCVCVCVCVRVRARVCVAMHKEYTARSTRSVHDSRVATLSKTQQLY